jgi:hypothetical protein
LHAGSRRDKPQGHLLVRLWHAGDTRTNISAERRIPPDYLHHFIATAAQKSTFHRNSHSISESYQKNERI